MRREVKVREAKEARARFNDIVRQSMHLLRDTPAGWSVRCEPQNFHLSRTLLRTAIPSINNIQAEKNNNLKTAHFQRDKLLMPLCSPSRHRDYAQKAPSQDSTVLAHSLIFCSARIRCRIEGSMSCLLDSGAQDVSTQFYVLGQCPIHARLRCCSNYHRRSLFRSSGIWVRKSLIFNEQQQS